ncbi:MAG: hypothetical protein ACK5QZ_07530 [Bacteroidota bacterium]|jgi:hypothetical protein
MIKQLLAILCLLIFLSCKKQDPLKPQPGINLPVWQGSQSLDTLFTGKWLIYQYATTPNGFPQPISDTLSILDNDTYIYAGQTPCNYALYPVVGSNKLVLSCTPWGSISGNVNTTSLQIKQINGIEFTNTFDLNQSVWLWIKGL